MFNFFKKANKESIPNSKDIYKSWDYLHDLLDNNNREASICYSQKNYARYYRENPIVYKCIDLISSGLSNIAIDVFLQSTDEKIENHPVKLFLKRPNQKETETSFFYKLSTWFLIFGEVFIQKIYKGNQVIQLNIINPLNVIIETDSYGNIIRYRVNQDLIYEVDQLTGKTAPLVIVGVQSTLHSLKSVDSLDSIRGLSKLAVSAYAIESFMASLEWNRNLLKNRAIPASVLEQTGMGLAHVQVEQLQEEMEKYRGSKNSGKWMLVPPGIKVSPLSLSPTEMDFKEMLDKMSEYIASTLGVPSVLLNLSNTTFNNMAEAKASLYRDAILPLYTKLLEFISSILSDSFSDIYLGYDEESIDALWEERKAKIESMTTAVGQQLLSIDEGRKELGYEERGGLADDLFIRSGSVPLELVNETQDMQDPDNNMEEDEEEINADQEATDEGRP